jgi:hypothetical protein
MVQCLLPWSEQITVEEWRKTKVKAFAESQFFKTLMV